MCFFFFFLFYFLFHTKLLILHKAESESFILGLYNRHLSPFPHLIHQLRYSYSNFQSTIHQKQYSNKKAKYLNKWCLCLFPQLIHQFRHSYSTLQSTLNQKQYSKKTKFHYNVTLRGGVSVQCQ